MCRQYKENKSKLFEQCLTFVTFTDCPKVPETMYIDKMSVQVSHISEVNLLAQTPITSCSDATQVTTGNCNAKTVG